jgi:hypothetical protein
MYGVLMSGRFRCVLEIGCYHGYSTTGVLGGGEGGAVDEVHFVRPSLLGRDEGAASRLGPGGKVKTHCCKSVQLLARDWR